MNKPIAYKDLNSSNTAVISVADINEHNWRDVLVYHVTPSHCRPVIMRAEDAIAQMRDEYKETTTEFFTEHPQLIAYAELWDNDAYFAPEPQPKSIGQTAGELYNLRISLRAPASATIANWPEHPTPDPHHTVLRYLPELMHQGTDDEPAAIQTSADDSSSQGSESSTRSSGAGVSLNPLIPLNQLDGIANLCTEFSELKASLTHFRNDCALICEYARTASELADKLAALQPSPAVARTRKPRAGKKVEPAAPSSTGNSVLDAL